MNTRCSTDLIFASDSPTYLFSTSEKKKRTAVLGFSRTMKRTNIKWVKINSRTYKAQMDYIVRLIHNIITNIVIFRQLVQQAFPTKSVLPKSFALDSFQRSQRTCAAETLATYTQANILIKFSTWSTDYFGFSCV